MKKRAKKRRNLMNSFLAPCLILLMGGYLVWSLIYNQVQISAQRLRGFLYSDRGITVPFWALQEAAMRSHGSGAA